MKAFLILFISIGFVQHNFAQNEINCTLTQIQQAEKVKQFEPCILAASNFILSKPLHDKDNKINEYSEMINAWMTATPDFTFVINAEITELIQKGDNLLLFRIYMASQARAAIESKKENMELALKFFYDYITNSTNGVEQTSKVKKFISDYSAGKLDKYLND